MAAATASGAAANTAWTPSPVDLTIDAVVGLDGVAQDLVVAGECVVPSRPGCSSQRRVEPSRSVNRNVTVPVGRLDHPRSPRAPKRKATGRILHHRDCWLFATP